MRLKTERSGVATVLIVDIELCFRENLEQNKMSDTNANSTCQHYSRTGGKKAEPSNTSSRILSTLYSNNN